MECRDFQAMVNELLDCRQPLQLADEASQHAANCAECSQQFSLFQQLECLFGAGEQRLSERSGCSDDDPRLAEWVQECLSLESSYAASNQTSVAGASASFDPVPVALASVTPVPIAMVAEQPPVGNDVSRAKRLPDRSRGSRHQAVMMALGLSLVAGLAVLSNWNGFGGGPLGDSDKAELQAGGGTTTIQTRDSNPLAVAQASPTPVDVADLQDMAKNWDESVVAFDRSWQNMAVGRVRAHQLPGIQPAVYPITGAVEAFRKNMIVRNQNGLAAGVRW